MYKYVKKYFGLYCTSLLRGCNNFEVLMGFKHLFFAFATSICLFSKVYSFDLFEGSRLELGYNTGKWISLDEDYSEASLFTPFLFSS